MRCAWGKLVVALVLLVAALQIVHMLLLSHLEAWGSSRQKRAGDEHRRNPLHQRGGLGSDSDASVYSGLSAPSSSPDAFAVAAAAAFSPEEELPPQMQAAATTSDVTNDFAKMVAAVKSSSVLDSSGEFKIVPFVAMPEGLKRPSTSASSSSSTSSASRDDVTLVTQCSTERLYHIWSLAERWDGPMSVTVFTGGPNLTSTLNIIAKLRFCSSHVRRNCSFHIVYPIAHEAHDLELSDNAPKTLSASSSFLSSSSSSSAECATLVQRLQVASASVQNYERGTTLPYPTNLLRNVGRRAVTSEFVFVVDVDLLPNSGLYSDFGRFARANALFSPHRRDDKTVYVIPAFEVRDDTRVPRDKPELLRLLEKMRARPFYVELCWKCQKHTDYEAWQREVLSPDLAVVFEVLWKDPWEPFYIGRNSAPLYDERFKQYGFNRISQVCELHIAGYKFLVLNNAFLVHQGLKTADSFHRKKDLDQEHNRLLFRQFKTELKDKYPDSSRRCY